MTEKMSLPSVVTLFSGYAGVSDGNKCLPCIDRLQEAANRFKSTDMRIITANKSIECDEAEPRGVTRSKQSIDKAPYKTVCISLS